MVCATRLWRVQRGYGACKYVGLLDPSTFLSPIPDSAGIVLHSEVTPKKMIMLACPHDLPKNEVAPSTVVTSSASFPQT